MGGGGGYYRYFAYLNLFMAMMLTLVLASSFPVMFVGWEGVGLCSYLLIGFEFEKEAASAAGKKAFLVNRVGDLGFFLGMVWIFAAFGTLNIAGVMAGASRVPVEVATGIGVLLFIGACGKSAQVPLYVWGPSALMVVGWVGALTALLAATMALRQNDIKRVLAYSTVSQLGTMFVAVGVGAFSAAIFHLMTHAFFKALLFLGAGSVIHALGGEQDLRQMCGLWNKIPRTFATILCAAVAIAGVPPFSGFFSKDAILLAAHARAPWMYWVAVFTAGMTAFYVFRAFFLAFFGEPRWQAA